MIRRVLKLLKCRKGLATVEAALILPIVATLTLAAADSGMLMMTVHKLESGLAVGGSYIARSNDIEADKPAAISIAVTGYPTTGHPSIVKDWMTTDVSVTVEEKLNDGADSNFVLRGANSIRVAHLETRYTYSGLGLLSIFTGGNLTLTASHEERLFGGGQ